MSAEDNTLPAMRDLSEIVDPPANQTPLTPPKNRNASALLGAIVPKTPAEARKMAIMLSHSKLVPKAYQAEEQRRDTADDIIVAGMWGAELGFSWIQSLKSIAVINGNPSIWGKAGYAIIAAQRDLEEFTREWNKSTQTATVRIKRRGFPLSVGEFSMADAKRAGLDKKNTYQAYPDQMCLWRAFWRAADPVYSDKFMGLDGAEDSMDRPAPAAPIAEPKPLPAAQPVEQNALDALFGSPNRPALEPSQAGPQAAPPKPDAPREKVFIKTVSPREDASGKVFWLLLSEDKEKRKIWTRDAALAKVAEEAVGSAWPVLIAVEPSLKGTFKLLSIELAPNTDAGTAPPEGAPPEDEAPDAAGSADPEGEA